MDIPLYTCIMITQIWTMNNILRYIIADFYKKNELIYIIFIVK